MVVQSGGPEDVPVFVAAMIDFDLAGAVAQTRTRPGSDDWEGAQQVLHSMLTGHNEPGAYSGDPRTDARPFYNPERTALVREFIKRVAPHVGAAVVDKSEGQE